MHDIKNMVSQALNILNGLEDNLNQHIAGQKVPYYGAPNKQEMADYANNKVEPARQLLRMAQAKLEQTNPVVMEKADISDL